MARILSLLTLFATLVAGTPFLLPLAKESVKLVAARDDPAALADLGLSGFTAHDAERGIRDALAADDGDLAASYLALADARDLAVPPALRQEVAATQTGTAQAVRSAKAFGMGFVTGQPEDLAGFAGAAASDLMVWGDIRDASREGLKLARGEDPDQLILGLSAFGLAVSAGTYATMGASLPVRVGISLVKVAKRTGRLSAQLARSLTRAVREAVDFSALRRLAAHPGAVDGAALKSVVRGDRVAGLTRMLDDTARIQAKAGTRAALEGMKVAEGGHDLSRVARLAEAKSGQTLAILKTLGRGAIAITGALLHLVWWAFVVAAWLFALVSSFNAFCVACARRLWRRKPARHKSALRVSATDRVPQATAPAPPSLPPACPEPAARFAAAVAATRRLAQDDGLPDVPSPIAGASGVGTRGGTF